LCVHNTFLQAAAAIIPLQALTGCFCSAVRPCYLLQGGGKRKGAFAIYLEPWHADIFEWLDMRKNHGKEEARARDLFYGLWINDLFMQRVEANQDWSLFCPNEAPGLAEVWGEEFEKLYTRCVLAVGAAAWFACMFGLGCYLAADVKKFAG
jgi:hypothetical protein